MVKIIDTSTLTPEVNRTLSNNELEWIYNGLDCCVTLEVFQELEPQLDETTRATYDFSRALQAPVMDMAMRGIRIDLARREEVLAEYKKQIEIIGNQFKKLVENGVGIEVNWNSHVALKHLFYDVLGITPIKKRNANGQFAPTVNRDALEKLQSYFIAEPFVRHLLVLRDIEKKRQMLTTELDADGRIRTNFNIAGTNTGRLSSSGSDFGTGGNLQNIDRMLRSTFIADEGMKFGNLDLEQADARNVGAILWDMFVDEFGEAEAGRYLDACESGDLHTRVCHMAWTTLDWPDDPSKWRAVADQIAYRDMSYRDLAKRLGHGTNFYGTPRTMAAHTHVAQPLIEDFQQRYFDGFPLIGAYNKTDYTKKNWHNNIRAQLINPNGRYLTTHFGRRRFFWGRPRDAETLRAAIAYEPQSMTADEIDTGIINLWRAHKVELLLQVHDSILFQYPEEQEDEIIPWAIETLTQRMHLKRGREFCVPVEAKVGWNYGDVQYNPDGTVKSNPDGLVKWKGHDSRTRPTRPKSLQDILK